MTHPLSKTEALLRNYEFRLGFCIGMTTFGVIETQEKFGWTQAMILFSFCVVFTFLMIRLWKKYPNL